MPRNQNHKLGLAKIDKSHLVSKCMSNYKKCTTENKGKFLNHSDLLKPISGQLSNLGFSGFKQGQKLDYNAKKIKSQGGKGTSNDYYQDNTILRVLDNYRRIVMSFNVVGNKAESSIKTFKSWAIKNKINSLTIDELNHEKDLEELRLIIKRLRHEFSRDRSVLNEIAMIDVENLAYHYVKNCISFLKNRVKQDATSNEEHKTGYIDVINPDFVIDWAKSIIENNKASDIELGCAIAALTGRRLTEVMKTAKFTPIVNSNNWIMFSGQLKLKDREHIQRNGALELPTGETPDCYSIPTLVDSSSIIKATKRLRSLQRKDFKSGNGFKFMSEDGTIIKSWSGDKNYKKNNNAHNMAVHTKYERTMNMYVKRVFNDANMTVQLLRSAYTEITFDHEITRSVNPKKHRALVLGHGDLLSQSNYDKFMLSTDEKFNTYKILGYQCKSYVRVTEESLKKDMTEESKKLLEQLEQADESIYGNTRAKSLHRIHDHVKQLIQTNGLTKNDIDSSWLRKQIIDGKSIGQRSVNQYLNTIQIAL